MDIRTDEVAERMYRFSVFVPEIAAPSGFTFNHFLIVDDEPLLFHCGLRKMFPLVSAAVAKISVWQDTLQHPARVRSNS